MKKIRVGLVGFGFVGPHHLDAIRRLGFAEVTAIATSSKSGAQAKARSHCLEKAYGDWRELIADPAIDVVDIAAPTHLHAPVALAAGLSEASRLMLLEGGAEADWGEGATGSQGVKRISGLVPNASRSAPRRVER